MKIKLLLFLLAAGIVTSLAINFSKSKESQDRKELIGNLSKITTGTKVLQIDLSGGIFYMGLQAGGLKALIDQIDTAAKDKATKGLFIRANSPGGSIVASQELYEAVKRFQKTGKPIITSVMDLCASGCYYAVLPSTEVVVNRGSIVGSIGVIMSTMNWEELYKKIGVRQDNITSVKYKDILSPVRKMLPEEKAHLQGIISKMHDDFVSDVVAWRAQHSSESTLRQAANGLVYTSDIALKKGLVDKIGDLQVAQETMAQVLGVPLEEIHFVRPAYQYWEELMGLQIQGLWEVLRSLWVGDWAIGKDIPQFHY